MERPCSYMGRKTACLNEQAWVWYPEAQSLGRLAPNRLEKYTSTWAAFPYRSAAQIEEKLLWCVS